jgi:RHS repeat-associated protein
VINTYVSNVVYQVGTGLLSQVSLGNTTREEYSYDSQRLQMTTKKVIQGSTNVLLQVTYNYQAAAGDAGPQAGNAGQIMTSDDFQTGQISYQYDSLGRLTTEVPGVNISYLYDRWGNLVQVDGPGYTDVAQVQTDGQGIPTNRYASVNGQPQGYDGSGNLTDDNVYLYKYDAAGRLREVYEKTGNILRQKFWYDHVGRRVKKEERPPGATAHWYYCLWSGEQVVVEYQTLVGTTFPSGTQPEPAAGTDVAANLRYQHWDLRSVRLVTDGGGNQVDTQSHYAYGEVMDSGSASPRFFTTYEREMTGLDYARARYYRSNHKRFTSPDRYRGSYRRGNPQSLNRYAYVRNDPIN